ncbi:MAG TPA: patatin-like phospholipase family protein, partial [Solirubrobacteraceae bacterium]|nr:patatin-like phospholipase family protein [Solirubrobacteraceae bacterium]
AYQAGVLVALERAGLTFAVGDGASGGTINLAMLLSGLTPAEMCDRWRTLRVSGFVGPPTLAWLLRGLPLPGLGSSDGIRRRVYPHLGIDAARIRAARGMDGTFNVCDFAEKACVAVPHTDIDLDLLVAAVSLPVLSPAVVRGGRTYVDAVWVKDVNVTEAVRRGADELWLVWAIGNHGVYRDGALQQYVHMIEIAANAALFAELADVAELNANATRSPPIRLHVIRPRRPLPLDPDLLLGRIDAATLIAMGHRDACEYLAGPAAGSGGVELGPAATRMEDPRPGVGWRETLAGDVGGPLRVRLGWEVDDLEAFAADGAGTLVGDVSHPAIGERVLACGGEFTLAGGRWRAELRLAGGRLELVRDQRAWRTVEVRLCDAAGGELGHGRLAPTGLPAWARTHARGVASMLAGARALARFAGIVRGSGGPR